MKTHQTTVNRMPATDFEAVSAELRDQAMETERILVKFHQLEQLWEVETALETLRRNPSWQEPTASLMAELRAETTKRATLIEALLPSSE
jgi:hypothetical protein